ncbi:hypothetical protein [Pseudoprimorskyibacter insulae]|uniref:Uncharacterized protein n=1 Tax=Pseudoprimorskyibacter insulae TaxID=1695997 RepID=A0A2R8AXB3_9RHOB|nr:hypothetical protein [Pseudoprimorskyibacter insulae]SPF80662.1 hypothetical protein PRI8871_02472 [Pseudoprimorskyibacter insulae]
MTDTPNQTPRKPEMIAYHVKDRGEEKDAVWNRVGAAWQHRDGKGFDIQMDATPVDGRLTLREQKREEYHEQRKAAPTREQEQSRTR